MNIFDAFTPGEMCILGIIIGILLSILVYIILGEKKYYADDELKIDEHNHKAMEFIYSLINLIVDLEGDETLVIYNDNDEIQIFRENRYD